MKYVFLPRLRFTDQSLTFWDQTRIRSKLDCVHMKFWSGLAYEDVTRIVKLHIRLILIRLLSPETLTSRFWNIFRGKTENWWNSRLSKLFFAIQWILHFFTNIWNELVCWGIWISIIFNVILGACFMKKSASSVNTDFPPLFPTASLHRVMVVREQRSIQE